MGVEFVAETSKVEMGCSLTLNVSTDSVNAKGVVLKKRIHKESIYIIKKGVRC